MNVDIKGVAVSYPLPDNQILQALSPIDVSIASGEFVALLGASGCGKSTLIRVIGGIQAPTQGSVHLDNQRVTEPLAGVSMMFQDANLMVWRTIEDNIALPLTLGGVGKRQAHKRVAEILPQLGLSDFSQAYPAEVSGGMAQRAALGRVLIQNPRLMLLDEPFGALDALTRDQISLDLLDIWRRERSTVILVTHNIQEAVLMSDRVLVMSPRPGRIIRDYRVNLPRPRHLEMMYEPEATQLMKSIRQALNS